jgi:SpoVK/Ycf46/Vps4 family AAA+-type ATPase
MEKKKVTKALDLLTAMERIIELLSDSGANAAYFRKASKYLKYVGGKLSLTREQSLLMALFVDQSNNVNIEIKEFVRILNCSTIHMLRYTNDIDELVRREFVCCSRDDRHAVYHVPMYVIEAFKKDECYVPKSLENITCPELFYELSSIFLKRERRELSYPDTKIKVWHLLKVNKQLNFTTKILTYGLRADDCMLLIAFCHLFESEGDDDIRIRDLDFIFRREKNWPIMRMLLENGNHVLQQNKLIEFGNDDGLADRGSFHLSQKAKDELLSELNITPINPQKHRNNLLHSEDIEEKRLFFDNDIETQVDELGRLLEEKHYQEICARLKGQGFRCGFTCLFYGAPGTGKTETVLQLARRTGRDIMQVNVSEIKSMWVGESEKNIKRIFDIYRKQVAEQPIAPILLFNEADAIIGKRFDGAERAVDKMENSIQNIILQELETLNGIFIATTNLVQNLDKAFERRFLYKVKFTLPTLEARMSIWSTMIPALSESESRTLAEKFNFSGGQIENIARHFAIDNILRGEQPDNLAALLPHCKNEKLEKDSAYNIGFHC